MKCLAVQAQEYQESLVVIYLFMNLRVSIVLWFQTLCC